MVSDFTLYLLYGLAFFTLGVAILSRDIRFSELGIAGILWLLAVFGIIHGFHEWLELLKQVSLKFRLPPSFSFVWPLSVSRFCFSSISVCFSISSPFTAIRP